MNIDFTSATVADIVKCNYAVSDLFESHGIDFCCGGDVSFLTACADANVDAKALQESILENMNRGTSAQPDFDHWPLDLLCDYLEKKHHRYIRETGPKLSATLEKLCEVHGSEAPWLNEVRASISTSLNELETHMLKEEELLFAPIRRHEHWDGTYMNQDLIQAMNTLVSEHETEGSRFKQMSNLTNEYTVPSWGCTTFHYGMNLLKEFEQDLHLHVHIENNILFPKLTALTTEH